MSHIEKQRSLHHGENGNGMDSPLQLFSKAKGKINKTFQEIAAYLEEAFSFLDEKCYVSEEFVAEVDKCSNEVRIFDGSKNLPYEQYWFMIIRSF